MVGGGLDPRKMRKMMKRMGVKMEELSDVQEVIIKLSERELVIPEPQVTLTKIAGQSTYQVVGEAHEREVKPEISDEDVELVMERAEVGREEV